MMQELAQSV